MRNVNFPILVNALKNTLTFTGGCTVAALLTSKHGLWLAPIYVAGVAGAYFAETFFRELRLRKGLY